MNRHSPRHKSAIGYVLSALMPYTEANLRLTFKPHTFFNELEKISKLKDKTLRSAYYRAQEQGYLTVDARNRPVPTKKGEQYVRRFNPKRLGDNAFLMVMFDIPEGESWKRQHLRRTLQDLHFQQIQKSVWATEYDYRAVLKEEIDDLGMQPYVEIFEAARL